MAARPQNKAQTNEAPGRRRGGGSIIEIEEAQKRRKERREEAAKAERAQKHEKKRREKLARPKMSPGKKAGVAAILGIAVLLFGFGGFRNIELTLEKAQVEQQYEKKAAEKARYEKELTMVNDPEYVEQQARERFHLLKDGEILYVFPAEQSDNTQ
ncbi:MAG: septum formation initiator family protein [Clostridiales Family XIII bacterium]|jgi:cell division protein FtsB|nr:septum formation initiator family protein [Clostridiales Family XIII bacterium]